MKSQKRGKYIIALLKYVKGFEWYLLISVLVKVVLEVLPIILITMAAYMLGDVLFANGVWLKTLSIVIVVLILLTIICSIMETYVSHDMSYRILTGLRDTVYQKIDKIAPAGIGNKQSGELVNIIIHDIEFFEWFYAHILTEWITVILIVLMTCFFLGNFSMWLPVVVLPFILMIIIVPLLSASKADDQGQKVRSTAGILNAEVVGGIQGIKDIISFGWKKEYIKSFQKKANDYAEAEIIYGKRGAGEKRVIALAVDCAVLITTICVLFLYKNREIELIWILPIIFFARMIFNPVKSTTSLSASYGFVFGAAQRVFELLQLEGSVFDNGTLEMEDVCKNQKMKVSFENVFFHYEKQDIDNKQILKNISFQVEEGETIALVAKSGGGKTTIARLLQRFWDVDSGKITINGIDIRQLRIEELRKIVTVVPQDTYLFYMSIADNLRLARKDAEWSEIKEACKLAQADEFIQQLPQGYETVVGERGMRLSGGEKQRIVIAQAFLKNSPVLVLDEASASLDTENERLINQAVAELKRGRATIMIAHRLSTIKSADKIVVISDGVVSAVGKYEELLETNGDFREMIKVQGTGILSV